MSILENPIPNEVLDNATSPLTDDRAAYKDSTYEIVSKVAYLIGVPKRIFDNEHEAPKVEVYSKSSLILYGFFGLGGHDAVELRVLGEIVLEWHDG